MTLQGRLHSECLSVLLNSCFALESYINSLGYRLLQDKRLSSLFHTGHNATAAVDMDAIEKMSPLTKWETMGRLKGGKGFDKSKRPFQDLKTLFRFRDDIVHDKVADYSDDRQIKRYNKKLPDPVFGFLTLHHAIFAADTYWGMVTEIHNILSIDMKKFHRHYNLKPWFDSTFEQEVRKASALYLKAADWMQPIGHKAGSG